MMLRRCFPMTPLRITISKALLPIGILLSLGWLIVGVALPVLQVFLNSLQDNHGRFVGLENYLRYLQTPALSVSIVNSIYVSLMTTVISVVFGFGFAYMLTRSRVPGKGLFKAVVMIPLYAPTLLNGIALTYLLGRKGLITHLLQSHWGIQPPLYGAFGIIASEVIYTFPQAVLILYIALSLSDARLYEAAKSLGAGPLRIFFTVTLPGVRYGLFSALCVCFILAFTDFGAPKVVGGSFNILATDIYKQVIGQQNFSMGAVLSILLMGPSVLMFCIDRMVKRKQASMVTSRFVGYEPTAHRFRDECLLLYGAGICLFILGFYGAALYASLVRVWPYDVTLGFWHYRFTGTGGGGYEAFFNSIRMSLYSALIGTIITFLGAYLIEKSRILPNIRRFSYFLSILPMTIPGLVIGLAYIFFFNTPKWSFGTGFSISNPFNSLYGTMGILVLSNIVHFYSVGFLTATTALKQLDREFESVSESMGVPFYQVLIRVTVPICYPAVLEIMTYYFVSSMATVSAVIFLYSADIPLASVAIANMDDAGDTAKACALGMLIVITNIAARAGHHVLLQHIRRKHARWHFT
uniref:Putative 2-aminoethylphosphonate ABC transporter permease subunit n=1 Tax=Desulfatirhabdium butyrativorans TaxID=340467 RepID=A0A7C4RND4_9BACT